MSDWDFDRMGLVLGREGRMYYAGEGGFGRWLPHWVRSIICLAWNKVVCFRKGHDVFTYPDDCKEPGRRVCVSCCKEFRVL
jgi:hypothetical protein